jgi:D-aspartate ligase
MTFAPWSLDPDIKVDSENPNDNRSRSRGAGAIVIGGDCGALGVVRSLGRAGVPTFFLSGRNRLASYSRYTRRHLEWPGSDHPNTVAWLIDIAAQHGLEGWTLFPAADEEVRLIARNYDELNATYRLVTPPWKTTQWFSDKALSYRLAEKLGIDYPKTYNISDAGQLDACDLQFPLILKPAMKEGLNALTRSKVWRIGDRKTLADVIGKAISMAGNGGLIVQELIPGDGSGQFSYAAVCQDGRPVVSLVARRLRQAPADFGTGTFVETVENKAVEEKAERLLDGLAYSGAVEMEFKRDSRDGTLKLLDINPRTWTWTSIGEVAGANFPLAMWLISQGVMPPRVRAQSGAHWTYLSRDLPQVCKQIFAGKLSPAQYLRSLFGATAFAAFATDDPLPAFVDVPLALQRYFGR